MCNNSEGAKQFWPIVCFCVRACDCLLCDVWDGQIFGGDVKVLRAVEEFTTTQSVERLVSVIHSLSL